MSSDPVVATAILDRLLHHSHVLTIRGDSYRLHQAKEWPNQPAAADGPPVAMLRKAAASLARLRAAAAKPMSV